MKILIIAVLFFPYAVFAESEGALSRGPMSGPRFDIFGYYGAAFVNPADINNFVSGTVPKMQEIKQDVLFGGGIGYRIVPRIEFKVFYDVHDAKNPTNFTAPAVANGGWELFENIVWLQADFGLFGAGPFVFYGAGAVGYPTYSHATLTLLTKTEYDTDRSVVYMALGGIKFHFHKYVALFAEGGYQFLDMKNLKDASGTPLHNSDGSSTKMDLSGTIIKGGFSFYF